VDGRKHGIVSRNGLRDQGYHFTPISSDGFSKEKLQTMRLFGADLEIFQPKTASWYRSFTKE